MLRVKNSFLTQEPIVEQNAVLEAYIHAIRELANRVNQPVASALTFFIGFVPMQRVFNSLPLLNSLLSVGADLVTCLLYDRSNVPLLQSKMALSESDFLAKIATASVAMLNEGTASPEVVEKLMRLAQQTYRRTYQDPIASAKLEQYTWHSGTYSSNGPSKIVKIRGAYNLFALFKMRPADFPHLQAYNQFKDIINNARFVSKRGNQGIVNTNTLVKDQQGKWFQAKYKAKALGRTNGDIRVYATQEYDREGDILLVFNAIRRYDHKK